MRIVFITILLLLGACKVSYSQNSLINEMQNSMENFDYQDVIHTAGIVLVNKDNLTQVQLEKIYTLLGIAYFSTSKNDSAQIAFKNLLMINKDFSLDSSQVSPKVIAFFNLVKSNHAAENNKINISNETNVDSASLVKIQTLEEEQANLKGAFFRSVILPGWGHLYLGNDTKGALLLSGGIISLGLSIYYIIDTKNKEKKYLGEIDPNLIAGEYNSYNTSYKIRNGLLISFAVIWLYTQFDLLFLNGNSGTTERNVELHPSPLGFRLIIQPSYSGISLEYNF
jgi:hypothetical protein